MIRAVIFDMDGVLIDSEPWWREAMAEVYARAGIPYSAQQAVKTQGMRIGDIARKTLEEAGMPVGWKRAFASG